MLVGINRIDANNTQTFTTFYDFDTNVWAPAESQKGNYDSIATSISLSTYNSKSEYKVYMVKNEVPLKEGMVWIFMVYDLKNGLKGGWKVMDKISSMNCYSCNGMN